ncbi:MAG: ATP-dependent DNA helicase RecG [Bacilli bacterium]|nr:ATP-dependent DNA helicase RecG [Bacilli bacterium]
MSDLSSIKGIGPSTINKLTKLDITNIDDLVSYYPYRYEILKKSENDYEHMVISVQVMSTPTVSYVKRLNILRFKALYKDKLINVVIYNRAFIKNQIMPSKYVTLIGKYEDKIDKFTASDIKLYDIGNRVEIKPIYHLVKGLTNNNMNKYINMVLDKARVIDYIPKVLKDKYKFLDKKESLRVINNPGDTKILNNAITRCKYEELFLFSLKMNELKNRNSINNKGYSRSINKDKVNEFIKSLPFELTKDQVNVLDDIFTDLESPKRMNRLVQGDVGSGKTIVAFLSMYALSLDKYQSALMAPTEILAHQHYLNMVKLFDGYELNIKEILGSTSKKEKEIIKEELACGKIDIIIGTHALLQDDISFNNLGLIITDEQHRFGVNQRSNLRNKGMMVDVLYLSATPIPRTYALTIYGDMDISIIKTMPSGRKPVKTINISNSKEDTKRLLVTIKKELDNNHQVYIVSPLIETEDEEADIKKIYDNYTKAFKDYSIGILHGKMTSKEKDGIMKEFQEGNINILISTTVIEVGVDVKNATLIIIYDAYKFGLATLHQLRGRVGRNDLESKCILVSDRDTKRLQIMEETTDGFKLAEEDFKLRGSGDLFGTRQSGDMNFKIANLTRDFDILLKAKEDSDNILKDIDKYPELDKILRDTVRQD